MKRSKMLECLLRRYESCLDSSVGDTFEGIVDALLDEAQYRGMLPPFYVEENSESLDPRIFDWEPEDE